jgi:hypothetical protein|tara:strand:- start:246 stop:572 length:327 start_codon:yes stop_codon:yes gene_type:complete
MTFIFLFITSVSFAQIKCNELINTVKTLKVFHRDYTLDSNWLQGVTFYEYYDNQKRKKVFFAIAKIDSKDYVFCDFPFDKALLYAAKWQLTSGEAFHKYIFNYKCNCE